MTRYKKLIDQYESLMAICFFFFLSFCSFVRFPNHIPSLPPTIISLLSSVLSKLTITTLLNLNCKRVRTHSPSTLLSAMTSSSSSLPPSTTAVEPIANVETTTSNDKQYLCLFFLITAGLLDEEMGSDEQEIIEMINLIIDVEQRKVGFLEFCSD